MRQCYQDINFRTASVKMIGMINIIISEYQAAGYVLTVRQLYYQLVARGFIENTIRSYKNIASLLNDARIAGLVDWDAIEDRTRSFITRSRWSSGASILQGCAEQYHMDMWEGQDRRVFVIVEKEALTGVLEGVCHEFDVPLLAARGYPSASVMREFCDEVVLPTLGDGQDVLILHLGDHDPSGIDMSRDLEERVSMFSEQSDFELRRIALNKKQVDEQKPPPNPAKTTDARYASYKRKFGVESWELDALDPDYLNRLVRENIQLEIDTHTWQARRDEIEDIKERIAKVAKKF